MLMKKAYYQSVQQSRGAKVSGPLNVSYSD